MPYTHARVHLSTPEYHCVCRGQGRVSAHLPPSVLSSCLYGMAGPTLFTGSVSVFSEMHAHYLEVWLVCWSPPGRPACRASIFHITLSRSRSQSIAREKLAVDKSVLQKSSPVYWSPTVGPTSVASTSSLLKMLYRIFEIIIYASFHKEK